MSEPQPQPEPIPEPELEDELEEQPQGISIREIGIENPSKKLIIEDEVIDVSNKTPEEIIDIIKQKVSEYAYANFVVVKDDVDIITSAEQLFNVIRSGNFITLKIVRNEKAG